MIRETTGKDLPSQRSTNSVDDGRYDAAALRRGGELFTDAFTRKLFEELADWDPQFSELFQVFVYGGMYNREILDQRTRELAAVGACVVSNALPQLRSHCMASVRAGATIREVKEIVMQMTVYCGWPFVLQAIRYVNSFQSELLALEAEHAAHRAEKHSALIAAQPVESGGGSTDPDVA